MFFFSIFTHSMKLKAFSSFKVVASLVYNPTKDLQWGIVGIGYHNWYQSNLTKKKFGPVSTPFQKSLDVLFLSLYF